jgi:alkylation response protein AidB-like acyl-CoA dehydrogenase
MHLKVVADYAFSTEWTGPVRDEFMTGVAQRGYLVNNIASEKELGSPNRGGIYATTARRTAQGWRIDGHKVWSTLSPVLTHAAIAASVEQRDGTFVNGRILVPMATPGIRIVETWDNLGMRATGSHDIVLEAVEVPFEHLLPNDTTGQGEAGKPYGLHMAAVYHGIATAARDFTVAYARERKPSAAGVTIAELPVVQHRVARMEMLLWQARTALFGTLETWETFPEHRATIAWQLAAAKMIVTNNAIDVTDLALRVVGSAGLGKRFPLERYFRDVRAGLGNPPSDDVALTIVGKAALGLG